MESERYLNATTTLDDPSQKNLIGFSDAGYEIVATIMARAASFIEILASMGWRRNARFSFYLFR